MYLPNGYFENEILFDCVKLLENVILQSVLFLWPENSDMEINYDYAFKTFSSLFKIKLKKTKFLWIKNNVKIFIHPVFKCKEATSSRLE
jgi:hypothetical protein